MTISELIKELERLKSLYGDLPVKTQTMSHMWAPEPEARPMSLAKDNKPTYILLNP